MKIKHLLALSFLAVVPLDAREKIPEKREYSKDQKVLNLSASSLISYEDAMTKFSLSKPDGYVIESIRYHMQGRTYVVAVTLRKSS